MNRVKREPAVAMQPVVDPAGWYAADIEREGTGMYRLDAEDVLEIQGAVASVEARGLDISDIKREDFPLRRVALLIERAKDELLEGVGMAVIRGLPLERFTLKQAAMAYWGIGSYFGRPVSQNAAGHVLGHVKDMGFEKTDVRYRGYQTNEDLGFHVDRCDIVGLFCLQTAREGGISKVASTVTLYNEMLERRPDLAAELSKLIYRDRRGEIPPGKQPWHQFPFFSFHAGHFTAAVGRTYIESAARFKELPPISPRLIEALDMFEALGEELCLRFMFERGDMQFLHNHVVMHSRTEYQDWPEPGRRRHLLRLWLTTGGARPLHPAYEGVFNGIVMPGVKMLTPLDV